MLERSLIRKDMLERGSLIRKDMLERSLIANFLGTNISHHAAPHALMCIPI